MFTVLKKFPLAIDVVFQHWATLSTEPQNFSLILKNVERILNPCIGQKFTLNNSHLVNRMVVFQYNTLMLHKMLSNKSTRHSVRKVKQQVA